MNPKVLHILTVKRCNSIFKYQSGLQVKNLFHTVTVVLNCFYRFGLCILLVSYSLLTLGPSNQEK